MDPLAQLIDIHLPTPIHQYPIAVGWWILASLIIIVSIYSVIRLRRHIKANKTKVSALKQLKRNPEMPVEEVLLLLKWAALTYFPRKVCANLYGKKFKQFLVSSLPINIKEKQRLEFEQQLQNCSNSFESIYHKNGDTLVDIHVNELAYSWLTLALPVTLNKANPLSVHEKTNKDKTKSSLDKPVPSTSTKEAIS